FATIRACGVPGASSACAFAMRLKYSTARRSSLLTPSPFAYMRPSCHCAACSPFSAAYWSARTALSLSPFLSERAADWKASSGVSLVVGVRVPSNAAAGLAPSTRPISDIVTASSDVRIAYGLGRPARMRHGPIDGRTDLLGVLPQVTRTVLRLARLP